MNGPISQASKWPELQGLGLTPEQQSAYNRFRFWRIVIASSIWYSFYYLGRLNWGICMPWIIKDLNITKMEAGMVAAGLFWSYAVSTFLSGRFGEIFGSRLMQQFGGIGTTILNIATALQSAYTGIFVTFTANGFVQGQAYAPTNMLITQWYPKARRGLATGIYATSMGVSSLVGWGITGYTVVHYGWRAAFIWPLLIFTLPSTIALYFSVRNRPSDAGFPEYKEPITDTISTKAEALKEEQIKGMKAWGILFKNWKFMFLCIASFSVYIGRFGLLTWVPLFYAETAGIKLKDVPLMTFALPFGMILLLMDLIPIKVMGIPWAIALQVLAGFFVLGINGVLFTAACDFGGRKIAGTAVGTINLFNYVAAGTQGVLIGGILTLTGSWTIVFATIAGFMVIGTILTFLTKE
ncbi:MAG: MFS transporter [Deltaproteobacteria bacterium]|nr:MFS transporter [Deltaproteobacteria bacterium]